MHPFIASSCGLLYNSDDLKPQMCVMAVLAFNSREWPYSDQATIFGMIVFRTSRSFVNK